MEGDDDVTKKGKQLKPYLREKRVELVRALANQGYNQPDIADLFGTTPQTIGVIINSTPDDYRIKWFKKDL